MAKVKGKAGLRVEIDALARSFSIQVREDGEVMRSLQFDIDDLPSETQLEAQLRGTATVLQQRVSEVNTSAYDKLDAISDVWEMWRKGDYRAEKVGGTRLVKPIFELLARDRKTSIGAIQKAWGKISAEKKAAYEEQYKEEIEKVLESRKMSVELEL